jgi:3-hydroxyacyl-CoA dehydrogenase/enoyl-CoA hydratase/3-hydroxybutyryl-CoA epimerase
MGDFHYKRDDDNIVTVTMDMDGPVNVMNDDCAQFLEATVLRLEAERDSLVGVIITSAKSTFFAGGDLKRIYNVQPSQAEEYFASLEWKKSLLRRLEKLEKPIVAAINGTALGGGFEICLACSHRIALNSSKTLLGLPEVSLGLLPGAGGVVRTVNMLGVKQALPFLLDRPRLNPSQALEAGIIDQLASDSAEMLSKARSWIKDNPHVKKPWDKKGFKLPGGDGNDPSIRRMFASSVPAQYKGSSVRLLAPEVILDVVSDTAHVDFDTALRIESRGLIELVISRQAKAAIALNFLQPTALKNALKQTEGDSQVTVNSQFLSSLQHAYHEETERLLDEGVTAVLINSIASQAGMNNPAHAADVLDDDCLETISIDISLKDIRERLLFSQAIAALRSLEQGLVDNIAAANIASVRDAGFPAVLGGVFQYIDGYGLGDEPGAIAFSARATELTSKYGEHFSPPLLLRQKADSAERFWP